MLEYNGKLGNHSSESNNETVWTRWIILAMAAVFVLAGAGQSIVMQAAEVQESAVISREVLWTEELSIQEIKEAMVEKAVTEVSDSEESVEEGQEELAQDQQGQTESTQEPQSEEVSGQAETNPAGGYETELLASLIFCEAGNQSFQGQVAVGAVVLNRIASSAYPNTMEEVIYQSGQFGPAGSGWLDQVRRSSGYTASAIQAAEAALAGENPIGDCLYFDQGGYGIQIGAHYFH